MPVPAPALEPPPLTALVAPHYEQFLHWIDTGMDRTAEYGSGEMAQAADLKRHRMPLLIPHALAAGRLRIFRDEGCFPLYAHPCYRRPEEGPPDEVIRGRVLEVLRASPAEELNRLELLRRAPELPLTARQLRPHVLALAAAGQLHAYTYPRERDPEGPPDGPEEWVSATPPRRGGVPLTDGAA